MLARLHPEPWFLRHFPVVNAEEEWHLAAPTLDEKIRRIREIEENPKKSLVPELYRLYDWARQVFQIKGIVQAKQLARSLPAKPTVSVIIPTWNRAPFLDRLLRSLVKQTFPRHRYEIIVVDDGSSDNTRKITEAYRSRLPLRYVHQVHTGLSHAKNRGIAEAQGNLLLFSDDDHVADADLIQEHVRAHEEYPDDNIAILGNLTWHPSLRVNEVMRYTIDMGRHRYPLHTLRDRQEVKFNLFLGGLTSVKKSYLTRHGIFNPAFTSICEDSELAYRLSRFKLKIVFNKKAASYMIRPFTFDEFCERCERQGRAQYIFNRLHPKPEVLNMFQVTAAEERWKFIRETISEKVHRVHELEDNPKEADLSELHRLYKWTFEAFRIKGMIQAMRKADNGLPTAVHPAHPSPSRRSILIVSAQLPGQDGVGSSGRLRHIVETLSQSDRRVTMAALERRCAERYARSLQALGIKVYTGTPSKTSGWFSHAPFLDLEGLLTFGSFDTVILSPWRIARDYLSMVRSHTPSSKIIVDTVELDFQIRPGKAIPKGTPLLLNRIFRHHQEELETYRRADRIWVVTKEQEEILRGLIKDVPIDVIPNSDVIDQEIWTNLSLTSR